jgi:hypothetical protein
MAYPPRSRRTKVRRRTCFAAAATAVCLVAAGFSLVDAERFQARSVALAGTPVTLRVEQGVAAPEVTPVRTGILAAERYARRVVGRPVGDTVDARVSGTSGCGLLNHTDGIPVGEAERGRLCIDTGSLRWQWLVLTDPTSAAVIAAHEYAHVVQADLGCLPGGSGEPRWLVEGMATELGWRALIAARRSTWSEMHDSIADGGAFDANLMPLQRYETAGGRDAEYALWHGATEALPGVPVQPLIRWCRLTGSGLPWRAAFERAFGLTTTRFYERFEHSRLAGMLTKRLVMTREGTE